MSEDKKQCNTCGEWKSLDSFRQERKRNKCKSCVAIDKREYDREYRKRPGYKERKNKTSRLRNATPEGKLVRHNNYLKHKETISKKQKLYYKNNRDRIIKRCHDYYHRPEIKERCRIWSIAYRKRRSQTPEFKEQKRKHYLSYSQRPEVKVRRRKYLREYRQRPEIKEREKAWRKEYLQRPEIKERGRISVRNRRARKRGLPNTFTIEQWEQALNYFDGCCAICGRQLNDMFGEFKAAADHWIPLSYQGDDNPGTVATNIIPLCQGLNGCNNRKNNTMPNEWLKREFGKRKAKKIMIRIQEYFDSLG
jgi:hypothetical protein